MTDWLDENLPDIDANRGPVELATWSAVRKLDKEDRQNPLAALALALSRNIDHGERVAECSRELRQCLAQLNALGATAKNEGGADEIAARRAQRRQA